MVDLSDAELVRLARAGEVGGLAVLLERHRARLHATGVAMLGAGPPSEDLVQDVFLVAVRRLDSLRDPEAAGGWLVGIARNLCRQRIRDRRESPLDDLSAVEDMSHGLGPEQLLDEHALGDWVWTALAGLSEPLREVVVLRYFSAASSYQAIAAVLDVPVGTVRRRLSEARRKLAALLRERADGAHDDHAALTRARRAFFLEVNDEYNRGLGCARLGSALAPDAELRAAGVAEIHRGPAGITRGLAADIEAGVRLRLLGVVAGQGITVVEGAFENPADNPDHCPPVTTQVFQHHGEQIRRVRLHYADAG
jgi:RNA polymerase sigma factor (sigma-70 family)